MQLIRILTAFSLLLLISASLVKAEDIDDESSNLNEIKRDDDENGDFNGRQNEQLNSFSKRDDESDNDKKVLNKIEKKRLETIDGVEIASSYKEYIVLAIGDLDDRLKKNNFQMDYYLKLIKARHNLFDQIEKEILRRRLNAEDLLEKSKSHHLVLSSNLFTINTCLRLELS